MEGVRSVKEVPMKKEGLTKFDLTLSAVQREESLELCFEFANDILDTGTVESMAVFMETLIRRAVSGPSDPIWKVVSLDPAEERRIEEWNSTVDVEPFKPLMTLFEEQVQAHPTSVALEMGSIKMSYEIMNSRVNQLANFLIEKMGVRPNDFVAIFSDICIELYISIYGVLKSGGAYLPIDLESPSDRISSLFADAKPKVVLLSKNSFRELVPCSQEFQIISLEDCEYLPSPTTNPTCPIKTGEESIYAIPTSGSTGIPKLAVNKHLGLSNLIQCFLGSQLQVTTQDRWLHKTPHYFDGSVTEIFSLCVGGCTIVLAPPESAKDPEELFNLIESKGITLFYAVPTVLREVLSVADLKELAGSPAIKLRCVAVGGEPLHWDLVKDCFRVFPNVVLDNQYGPSEASCDTTIWRAPRNDSNQPRHWPPPLGKPPRGAKVFLVDKNFRQVPFGAVGEICTGGIAVGKGYVNREQLNAEKFIDVPFSSGKIYRSGDLGRIVNSSEELQFIGRIDFQVKINGLRIELGEIESALHSNPCVKDAVVVVKTNLRTRSKHLAGYIVPSQDTLEKEGIDIYEAPECTKIVVPNLENDLLDFLSLKLPQYMIPGTLTILSSLPINRSGKTNRKALEAMSFDDELPEEADQPPTTENENLIYDIWQRTFGFTGGIRTNFFHAGGNSITLTKVSKVLLSRGIDITMEQFFQEPTIFGLARIADLHQHQQQRPLPETVPKRSSS